MFRNLPLFGFLAGLVIFFYIFYVYQAQNAELSVLRERYEMEQVAAKQFRSESAELKARIEKFGEVEKILKFEKSSFETKYTECSKNLFACNAALEDQKNEASRVKTEKGQCSADLESQKSQVAQLNDAISAMRTAAFKNEAVINGLSETINGLNETNKKLREELEQLKNASASSVVQPPGQSRNENVIDVGPIGRSGKEPSSAVGANVSENATNGTATQNGVARPALFLGTQQNKSESSRTNGSSILATNAAAVPPPPPPQGQLKLDDFMARNRPLGPADRLKMGEKMDEPQDDGRLVAAGEYKNDAEDDAIPRPNDEGAPDFENDEKRIKEPDV